MQSLGNFYIEQLFTFKCIEQTEINKKRPGMAHFKRVYGDWELLTLISQPLGS